MANITIIQAGRFLDSLDNGDTVVTGDAMLDAVERYFVGDLRLDHIRSLPNPNRIGILDRYVATMDSF